MDNWQGFAVEGKIQRLRAEKNSKEFQKAGQNNRNLAQEATSVTSSEWELFVTE